MENKIYITFFHVLAFTGLRKGELLAMEWTDVDFENKTIFVRKTIGVDGNYQPYIDTPKTESSYAKIWIDDISLQLLKRWKTIDEAKNKKTKEAKTFIFTTDSGQLYRPQSVNDWLKWIRKKFPRDKKIKPHDFRHTHCSLCFEAGLSVAEVQHRLRHQNYRTTMDIYNHLYPSQLVISADKFAQYMKN